MTAAPSSWTELPACTETPTVGTTGQFQESGQECGSSHPVGSWSVVGGATCVASVPIYVRWLRAAWSACCCVARTRDRGPGFCGWPVSLQLNHNKAQALLRRPSAVLVSGSLGRAAG